MALVRWNPWQDLFDVRRDMDDLVRRFFGSSTAQSPSDLGLGRGVWAPAIDVFHRDEDLVVRAELPGIDPEKDLDISLHENVLRIRGERKQQGEQKANGFYRIESSFGAFERSVALPEDVTDAEVRATYENGILEIVVPGVAKAAEPKRIPVRVGGGRKAISARGRKKSS